MTSGKKIWTRMENSMEQQDYLIPAKVLLTTLYIRKRAVLNSMAVLIPRAVILVHYFCSLFLKTNNEINNPYGSIHDTPLILFSQ